MDNKRWRRTGLSGSGAATSAYSRGEKSVGV